MRLLAVNLGFLVFLLDALQELPVYYQWSDPGKPLVWVVLYEVLLVFT